MSTKFKTSKTMQVCLFWSNNYFASSETSREYFSQPTITVFTAQLTCYNFLACPTPSKNVKGFSGNFLMKAFLSKSFCVCFMECYSAHFQYQIKISGRWKSRK